MASIIKSMFLFSKGSIDPAVTTENIQYIEALQTFTYTGSSAWITKDLSGEPFNVPPSSVVEVIVRNLDANNEQIGGIRAVDSTLERKFTIHEWEDAGRDSVTLFTQTDANSCIEVYGSSSGIIDFVLVGYWTSGLVYVEAMEELPARSADLWQEINLTNSFDGYLIPGYICELVGGNNADGVSYYAGCRSVGSQFDRKILLQEAEAGGYDFATFLCELKNGTEYNKAVELYRDDITNIDFWLVGFFAILPSIYTELNTTLQGPPRGDEYDATWIGESVGAESEIGVLGSGVVLDVNVRSRQTFYGFDQGIRESGTSLQRKIEMHNAEAPTEYNAWDCIRMHVNTGPENKVETYYEDTNIPIAPDYDYEFMVWGVWGEAKLKRWGTLDLYIRGREADPSQLWFYSSNNSKMHTCGLTGDDLTQKFSATGWDGFTIDWDTETVYFVRDNKIGKTTLTGPPETILHTLPLGTDLHVNIVLHKASGLLFTVCNSDNGTATVNRCDTDGNNYTNIATFAASVKLAAIALDQINDKVYFADTWLNNDKIYRCNLDGSALQTLLTYANGLRSVLDIKTDPTNDKFYYSDTTQRRISRANLDGSSPTTIYQGVSPEQPASLQIDFFHQKLYWGTRYGALINNIYWHISRSDLDGSNVQRILEDSSTTHLNLDWGLEIERIPIPITNKIKLYIKGPNIKQSNILCYLRAPEPYNDELNLYAIGPRPYSGEIHMSLKAPEPIASDIYLYCHVTWQTYVNNMTLVLKAPESAEIPLYITAKGWPATTELYITSDINTHASGAIEKIIIDPSGSDHTHEQLILSDQFKYAQGIVIDQAGGKMYWINEGTLTTSGAIYRANLTGEFIEIIASGSDVISPYGIVLYPNTNKIYWTDSNLNAILRADLNGDNREIVASGETDIDNPKGIAFDLLNGMAYYIANQTISRARLPDFTEREVVIELNSSSEKHLCVDGPNEKIYWTHSSLGYIRQTNFTGNEKINLITDLDEPTDLKIDCQQEKLYWADKSAGKIQRSNLDGSNIETIFTFNPIYPIGLAINYPLLEPTSKSKNLLLYLKVPEPAEEDITLYLENWASINWWSSFIPVPGGISEEFNLCIYYGSASGESFAFNELNLYSIGKDQYIKSTTHPLYMEVPSGAMPIANNWGVFLQCNAWESEQELALIAYGHSGAYPYGLQYQGYMPLFICNSGTSIGWYPYNNNWNIFLRTKDGSYAMTTLYMSGVPRIPVFYSDYMTMVVSGICTPIKYMSLYTYGVSGVIYGNTDLSIPYIIDDKINFKTLYAHGY